MKLKYRTLNILPLFILSLFMLLLTACGGTSSVSPSANNSASSTSNQPVNSNNTAVSSNKSGFHYEIRDINDFHDGDRLRIYANIANTGQDVFIGTRYTLSLLDADGSVVATDLIQTQTDIVPPGKTSPIWFFIDNPPAWTSYEIVVSDPGMRFGDFDGEVVNISITPETGNGNCDKFTVTNNDNIPTSFIFIAERHLDNNGRMIDVYVHGVNTETLQPGESVIDQCYSNAGPYELTAVAWHIID